MPASAPARPDCARRIACSARWAVAGGRWGTAGGRTGLRPVGGSRAGGTAAERIARAGAQRRPAGRSGRAGSLAAEGRSRPAAQHAQAQVTKTFLAQMLNVSA